MALWLAQLERCPDVFFPVYGMPRSKLGTPVEMFLRASVEQG